MLQKSHIPIIDVRISCKKEETILTFCHTKLANQQLVLPNFNHLFFLLIFSFFTSLLCCSNICYCFFDENVIVLSLYLFVSLFKLKRKELQCHKFMVLIIRRAVLTQIEICLRCILWALKSENWALFLRYS